MAHMITKAERAGLRRRQLRRLFNQIRKLDIARPRGGWIREIRTALGMTSGQLAKRMRIDQTTLSRLEQSEAKDTITIASLERAARALECRVVYALVPERSLDEFLHDNAQRAAGEMLKPVTHTMALEAQTPAKRSTAFTESELANDLIRKLDKCIWDVGE